MSFGITVNENDLFEVIHQFLALGYFTENCGDSHGWTLTPYGNETLKMLKQFVLIFHLKFLNLKTHNSLGPFLTNTCKKPTTTTKQTKGKTAIYFCVTTISYP